MLKILSASDQVATHIRSEIVAGNLKETLPGVNSLAATLGVNHKTVVRALEELESEGILVSQGPRQGRLIALSGEAGPKPMRIGILTYEFVDQEESYLSGIHHALSEVGHIVSYAGKSLTELKMDVKKVARFVEGQDLDAWVVVAGSRLILEWFCEQPLPVFALFGRRENLPIAGTGPRSDLAFSEAVHRLIGLGHRRVVHICRGDRRKPNPGKSEQKFLEILASHGLPVGDYNLPDWEETPEGFQNLLRSLFQVTPPTALIFDESSYLLAALQFLGSQRLRVPDDVSVFCASFRSDFAWCQPPVAHLRWDTMGVVRRVVRWAATVSHGHSDTRNSYTPTTFVDGGTIGPAPSDLRGA